MAHLLLDNAAASSLLQRFVGCRSDLLREILEGSGAACPGSNKGKMKGFRAESHAIARVCMPKRGLMMASSCCHGLEPRFGGSNGLLPRLCAAAMAYEGTIVIASQLCGTGQGPPALIATALQLVDSKSELLQQKVKAMLSALQGANELSALGLQFVKAWEEGPKSFAGRFEELILSHSSTSCSELGRALGGCEWSGLKAFKIIYRHLKWSLESIG